MKNCVALFVGLLTLGSSSVFAAPTCNNLNAALAFRKEVSEFKFDFPGLKVASITDPTLSTGATLFLFPKNTTANYDARGGSVAAAETTLLDEGSYSNEIDGITFSGGSTMGLDVAQGVRRRIFDANAAHASDFDIIPSVPGAVVYDYGARIEPTQNKLVYPDQCMGMQLYDHAVEGKMMVGRVGAGTSTTTNKSTAPIWGGQGAAITTVSLPGGVTGRIFTAVALNASGNVTLPNGITLNQEKLKELQKQGVPHGLKENTTLSLVLTDISMDRSQLKRLAIMVHEAMGRMIFPFHSLSDGDILFAVSMNKVKMQDDGGLEGTYDSEVVIQKAASDTMNEAIVRSVSTANTGTPPPSRKK